MGHLTWGDIVAILGSLASVFGGVRWLLAVYFKQQIKLDAARKSAYASSTKLLENRIESLETKISDYHYELEKFAAQMEEMKASFDGTKESAERVYAALREFVAETKNKFKKIDEHQSPEKYNAVEVKPDEKTKLGKVVVKS